MSLAHAQSGSYRPIRSTEVSGVDLQIEGPRQAQPGDTLRYRLVAFDVVGTLNLRPAAKAMVRASVSGGASATEVECNDDGVAFVSVTLPTEREGAVNVGVEVRTRAGVRRRFSFPVSVGVAEVLDLRVPEKVQMGEAIRFGGALRERVGVAERTIRVALTDEEGAVLRSVSVRTNASGLFTGELQAPMEPGEFELSAIAPHSSSEQTLEVTAPPGDALVVSANWSRPVVRPGEAVEAIVYVRDRLGRPVANAAVDWAQQANEPDDARLRTNNQGMVRIPGPEGALPEGEHSMELTAAHSELGRASTTMRLFVRKPVYAALAVEGGVVVPGIRQRIFALTSDGQGHLLADGEVEFHFLNGTSQRSNVEAGLATIEIQTSSAMLGGRCGGDLAMPVDVVVRGERLEYCLVTDPDVSASVQVVARTANTLDLRVSRVADAARLPVAVVAWDAETQSVLAEVVVPAAQTETRLAWDEALHPVDVVLRARAVRDGRELRGLLNVVPMQNLPSETVLTLSAHSRPDDLSSWAVPWAEGDARGVALGLVTRLTAAATSAQRDLLLQVALARWCPRDFEAPYVLRSGEVVSAPMAEQPTIVLNDPWRSRERFVSGRLATAYRGLETLVAEQAATNLDSLVAREGTRWVWKREVLRALPEVPVGLGGEPLAIADLERLDSTFTFHDVAKRVTRRALMMLLVRLDEWIRARGLHHVWARSGDPGLWLETMARENAQGLVDGWGRPFRLIPTTRPRFSLFQVVAGYELISAGPDGNYGNGDDIVDPRARVLRSGSVYASAVGEDVLVAKLGSVVLGRATVQTLMEPFETYSREVVDPSGVAASSLGELPSLIREAANAALPGAPIWSRTVSEFVIDRGRLHVQSTRLVEPRSAVWMRVPPLHLVRRGEVVQIPVLLSAGPQRAEVRLASTGQGAEHLWSQTQMSLGAGESKTVYLRLVPNLDCDTVELELSLADGGVAATPTSVRMKCEGSTLPIRRSRMQLVTTGDERRLEVDGEERASRVLLLTPDAIWADPLLARMPPLQRWARARLGQDISALERNEIVHSAQQMDRLPFAIAGDIAALAAVQDSSESVQELIELLTSQLMERLSIAPTATVATTLVMLSQWANALPPEDLAYPFADTRSILPPMPHPQLQASLRGEVARLRERARSGTLNVVDRARVAAALLAIDARDVHGRWLLRGLLAELEDDDIVSELTLRERTVAGLGLAIASAASGDIGHAESVAENISQELAFFIGRDAEVTAWYVAAALNGAFGQSASRVEVDGEPIEMHGVFEVRGRSGARVNADGSVLVRVEAESQTAFEETDDRGLEVTLHGDTATVLERLYVSELRIHATRPVRLPIVEIQLPTGVALDAEFLTAMRGTPGVAHVDVRGRGFLRIILSSMTEGQVTHLRLGYRHQVLGELQTWGIAASSQDLGEIATSPQRRVVVVP